MLEKRFQPFPARSAEAEGPDRREIRPVVENGRLLGIVSKFDFLRAFANGPARGGIGRDGAIPISTMGGLKARGDAGGATGVYQIVEVVQQLRGCAGANQIANARIGMAQNLGATGATAVTHILMRDE